MGKVLVLYHSHEGKTKKMAEVIAEGARQVDRTEVRLLGVEQASRDDVLWCDGMALGSPTYLGTVSARMKQFWEEEVLRKGLWQKIDGKIGTAFTSEGGWGGGAELTCMALMHVMMNFGFLVFGVTDYTGKKITAHYGATLAGEPRLDKEALTCFRTGVRLAEWVSVYVDGNKDQHPLKQKYKRWPADFE